MSEDDLLRILEQRTRPRADAVERVRARALGTLGAVDTAIRSVPGPRAGATQRVRQRLAAPPPKRRPSAWALPVGGIGLVAAASLAVLLWPAEATVAAAELGAEPIVQLTDKVRLEVDGEGAVAQTPQQAPVLQWRSGAIDVEVEPNQGIRLVVETPEATVTVLGTRFEVERSALGTQVSVARGKVAVQCVQGESVELTAQQSVTCLPTRPAALLGRARALVADGSSGAEVADAVRLGLVSAEGPVRAELLMVKLELALREKRSSDALELGRLYLSEAHASRRDEVQALVEALEARASSL